jgi:hypothetical protein
MNGEAEVAGVKVTGATGEGLTRKTRTASDRPIASGFTATRFLLDVLATRARLGMVVDKARDEDAMEGWESAGGPGHMEGKSLP